MKIHDLSTSLCHELSQEKQLGTGQMRRSEARECTQTDDVRGQSVRSRKEVGSEIIDMWER
jgi:hypothetical protein